MKKIMMIAAMMVAAVSANAQFEPGTFSIQPKVGVGLSKVSNMPALSMGTGGTKDLTLDKSLLAGGLIGAEAEYQIAKPFSLAAGLNFSMQGCQWEDGEIKIGDAKTEIKDTKMELNYLNLPIVANFYLFKGFAIKAGVQFGYLLSAKFKSESKSGIGNMSNKVTTDVDFKDQCNKFDISIPVGVSYQVPTVPVYIDARAIFGVSDIVKDVPAGEKNCRNQVFQLTVGYKFAL